MIEPLMAILLITGPWIFGFDDIDSCTIVSVVVGALMLASGLMTRWRFAVVKLIPLPVHFMTDVVLGIALIVTPFAADVSDRGDATRFMVILGALELIVALATRWDLREEAGVRHGPRYDRPATR